MFVFSETMSKFHKHENNRLHNIKYLAKSLIGAWKEQESYFSVFVIVVLAIFSSFTDVANNLSSLSLFLIPPPFPMPRILSG